MSKLDQLKALREAKASRRVPDPVLAAEPATKLSARKPMLTARKEAGRTVGSNPATGAKLKRGRPKVQGPRPWEAEGMSRRTWYRRQKEKAK